MQLPEKDANKDYEFVDHSSRKPAKKISPLFLGLLFLAAGIGCSYYFIYEKLQQMAQHSTSISYSVKMIFLGPTLLLLGLYLMIIRPKDFANDLGMGRKWAYFYIILFIVAMIAFHEWFKATAMGYGYSLQ